MGGRIIVSEKVLLRGVVPVGTTGHGLAESAVLLYAVWPFYKILQENVATLIYCDILNIVLYAF